MSSSKSSKYKNTENKVTIRKMIDLPLIEELHLSLDRCLSYFGLPGERAQDIQEWREHICRIDAVEHISSSKKYMLESITMIAMDKDFRLFESEIEKLIAEENASDPKTLRQYDLINLDFEGPVFSSSSGNADKRIKCIDNLLRIQNKLKSSEMVLLITLQAARAANSEFKKLCREAMDTIPASEMISRCLDHAMRKHTQKHYLAIGVPLWIYSFSQYNKYDVKCRNIVFYKGTSGVPMAHFTFVLKKIERRLPSLIATKAYDEIPLCSVIEVVKGSIQKLDLFGEVITDDED